MKRSTFFAGQARINLKFKILLAKTAQHLKASSTSNWPNYKYVQLLKSSIPFTEMPENAQSYLPVQSTRIKLAELEKLSHMLFAEFSLF